MFPRLLAVTALLAGAILSNEIQDDEDYYYDDDGQQQDVLHFFGKGIFTPRGKVYAKDGECLSDRNMALELIGALNKTAARVSACKNGGILRFFSTRKRFDCLCDGTGYYGTCCHRQCRRHGENRRRHRGTLPGTCSRHLL